MRKVILFCAATLFSLLSFAQESDADIVKVGDNIPAFTLHSTANGTINSADLKGKVALINIFATWCGTSKANWLKFRKYSGLNIKTTRFLYVSDRSRAYRRPISGIQ